MATVGHVWPEMKEGEDRMREQEGGMAADKGEHGWMEGWEHTWVNECHLKCMTSHYCPTTTTTSNDSYSRAYPPPPYSWEQ